ncbi:MAG TPA: NADH-quinone oxidoreductase subunit C [Burkholderiaceae bacterium]|nr:NADH-quinone oxidoreductase subunit C [Burkholderiaceae bacterium]
MNDVEELARRLEARIGARAQALEKDRGELTLCVAPGDWLAVAAQLRDDPQLHFEQCVDLCGVDYLEYGGGTWSGRRFAVVAHLLSVAQNWRLRLRVFCDSDELPIVASLIEVWPSVGWYEREAFDLLGILFEGHPDLRRILTDYGFVGHPFRRNFPISGTVEMRYDPEQRRVIYQPVSIEPREIVPRVIREEGYARGPTQR